MTDMRGLFVLHAVLLRTGKVLCFCGHVEVAMYAPLSFVFDPKLPGAQLPAQAFPMGADLFCCHYVQLQDGKILAMGGSQHDSHDPVGGNLVYRGSTGSKTIGIFDPLQQRWDVSRTGASINELQQGRWYPTAVTLGDGRVAVFSGRRELDDAGSPPSGVVRPFIAHMVEILSPPDWSSTELQNAGKDLPIYPGLHLAPNGRIYFTHTNWGQEMPNPNTASIAIGRNATSATWTDHGIVPNHPRREEGMSVLLPPAQDGKILVIGGTEARDAANNPTVTNRAGATFTHIADPADPLQAEILDTTTNPPTWTSVGPMSFGRVNGHCVILPDATVLICGGHDNYKWQNRTGTALANPTVGTQPSLHAEIFDPSKPIGSQFRAVPMAERADPATHMQDPRMYHSVALLLPDGRVFTAGGADPNRQEPPPGGGAWVNPVSANFAPGWVTDRMYGSGMALNAKTFEIYEPPYFFKGPRPTLTDVMRNGTTTRRIEYGQSFTVTTPQANDIADVALIRPAACTHHTDSEQRFVRLSFTKGAGQLSVTAVTDPNVAPPGYYMLWIVDSQKRPCEEAIFIRLMPKGTTCFVATAAYDSPEHGCVTYLRDLREELRNGSRAGRSFVGSIGLIYDRLGPRFAEHMYRDETLRTAVRDGVVSPFVAMVTATERVCRRLSSRHGQHVSMIALFSGELLLGIVAAPILLGRIALRYARERMRRNG
ncbi:MAG: DUF1929 domain-containing protein [Polyangiaceae bacterium]